MLKLRSISLRNWCKTAEANIVFPASGYVLVRGQNLTATGKVESNGAGKTAIGEALTRTLLGASLSTSLADYSRDGGGDTYVKVVADFNNEPLVVELGYKCDEFPESDGEGLRFTHGNHFPVESPRVASTRAALSQLVGVSPEASLWTVFIDGERLKFNRMSQDAALTLLMEALNQPPWDDFKKRADKRKAGRQTEVEKAEAVATQARVNVDQAGRQIEQAKSTLASVKASYDAAWSAYEQRLIQHKADCQAAADAVLKAATKRDELKKQIREAEKADAEKFGALELERSRLTGERRTAESYLSGWKEELGKNASDLRHAQQEVDALKSGKACPSCGKALKGPPTEAELTRAQKKLDIAVKQHSETSNGRRECQECLAQIDADLETLEQKRASLKSARIGQLSSDLETVEETLTRADRRLRDTDRCAPSGPSDSDVQRASAVLTEREVRLVQAQEEVKTAAVELANAEHRLRISTYWHKAFSPVGIPNLVLRQTIGPLNDTARLMSEALAGGVVKVRFSADTELASGVIKPKLVTEIETLHGASKLSRNSKGEVGRANLIIAETQTQVGRVLNRVGYRWFDEVVNSQDPLVRKNIFAYIKRQSQERSILNFVVDHHEEAETYADHILVAEKSAAGLTTYRWES